MKKELSIVRVDTRNYRIIARENWGLTKEQMKGMHVHHRIRLCDGGTNDPSNLYVCSPWYHDVVWHGGSGGFIELASEGGKKRAKIMHAEKDDQGRSKHTLKLHQEKDELGKSLHALKINENKDEWGRSVIAVKGAESTNAKKDENGKSVQGIKNAKRLNAEVWESTIDGFRSNPGAVARHNKSLGWDRNARIRVG